MSGLELQPRFAAVTSDVVEDLGGDLVCADLARDEAVPWCGYRLPRTSTVQGATR